MSGAVKAVSILLAIVAAGAALYIAVDPERRDIDATVRASAGGQFVRLSDGFTHYEVGGPADGPVVVLVAGMSVPYYIWDPTFAALSQAGFRVLRYDYFGRGYSDHPRIVYAQDAYVRQLKELLDAVGIRQPVGLVGLSFGGSVVTSFADKYADRVRSLAFVDPAFWSLRNVTLLESMPVVWNYLTAIFEERWWPDTQPDDFLHPGKFPDWADRYRQQLQYRGFRYAQYSTSVANARVDQAEEMKRVGANPRPVIAFWGKDDRAVPIEFAGALLQAMPQASLVTVEEAGHLPHLERPDVVHPQLLAFLRR